MIVIILIILVILKLLQIFFSYELYDNIDDYVLVYNHIKKNSLIFTITGYNTIINNKIINKNNSLISIQSNLKHTLTERTSDLELNKEDNLDYNYYINLNLEEKLKLFGKYENYLNKLREITYVNDEFIQKYYPELRDDKYFELFIKELNPIIVREVKLVLDLYQYIIKFNKFKEKLVIVKETINDDNIYSELFHEYKNTYKELVRILKELGSDKSIEVLLENISNKYKNDIVFQNSILNKDNIDLIKNEPDYINMLKFLKRLMKKDLILPQDDHNKVDLHYLDSYLSEDEFEKRFILFEDLLLKIFSLMKFIQVNKIITDTKDKWFDEYINEIILFSKVEKIETYKIKKGDIRKKRMRPGSILTHYKEILNKIKKDLELIIIENINEIKYNREKIVDTKESLISKIYNFENIYDKDFIFIYDKVTKAFNIDNFIKDFSINISEVNLNEQIKTLSSFFDEHLKKSNLTHDDLIYLYNLYDKYSSNYIRFKDNKIMESKQNSLNSNSYLYIKLKEIIDDNNLSNENKQLLLEKFILGFEKEFTLNIIKNVDRAH